MKIQLDTNSKTIKLEESVNLKELFELLDRILPDNQWQEYNLETNTIISHWTNPIIIEKYPPYYPYPWTTYDSPPSGTGTTVYCIDANT